MLQLGNSLQIALITSSSDSMAAAYTSSPKWVKRMEELFDQSDLNKDGYLSIEDFEQWVENIKKEVKATPDLIEKLLKAARDYWGEAGLIKGVRYAKDQFVKETAKFMANEKSKHDEGKEIFLTKYMDAVFDVVDTNHDGYLQLNEYEKMMKASNFDAGTAKSAFDTIDTNHDGKLSRKELKDYTFQFWFIPGDTKSAGFFGLKYE